MASAKVGRGFVGPGGGQVGPLTNPDFLLSAVITKTQTPGISPAPTGFYSAAWLAMGGTFALEALVAYYVRADAIVIGTKEGEFFLAEAWLITKPEGAFTAAAVIKKTVNGWLDTVHSGGRPATWVRMDEFSGAFINHGTAGIPFNSTIDDRRQVGKVDYATQFNGTTEYGQSASAYVLALGNVLTIEAWMVAYSSGITKTIYGNNNAATPALRITASTWAVAILSGSTTIAQTVSNVIVEGQYHHIVYTRSGTGSGTHAIWVDGIKRSLTTNSATNFSDASALKFIGSRTAALQFHSGDIDEVVVYARKLSDAEILAHYRQSYQPALVNAFIQPYFRVDAWLERTVEASFAVNALITVLIQAIIRREGRGVFVLSAFLARNAFTLDAAIRPGGSAHLDAVLKAERTAASTLDAFVFDGTTRERTLTLNAALKRAATGSRTLNAVIARLVTQGGGSATIDALQLAPAEPATFTLDASLHSGTWSGSMTVDADIRGGNEQRGTLALAAVLGRQARGLVVLEAWLERREVFHLEAWLAGAIAVNAVLRLPLTFTVAAVLSSASTIDAVIFGTRARTMTVNAVVADAGGGFPGHEGSFTAAAIVVGSVDGLPIWVEAVIALPATTQAFTLDAFIGTQFAASAWIARTDGGLYGGAFSLFAYIKGNTTVIWPDDGGPATDPDGNPLPDWFKASRKYRVSVLVDGTEVTGDVIWNQTTFTQNAKTNPGTFDLALKGAFSFDGGEEVIVTIDDFRVFGGYALSVERSYAFSADAEDPITTLHGADFNVLFDKLIVYNKASVPDPSGKYTTYKSFKKGSLDTKIINKVFSSYVDLPPGFDYTTYVETVDTAAPEKPWTMPESGSPLRQVMQSISQVTEAVWWIDPYMHLHYGSRYTVTAPFPITDGLGGISSQQLSMSEDISQLVTETLVWGTLSYTVDGDIRVAHRTSSAYATLGPWQSAEFRSDLHHTAYINRRADSIIDRYGQPIKRAKVVIFEPGYQAGQVADVRLTEHGLQGILVIRSMTLTMAVSNGLQDGFYYAVPRYELQVGLDPEEPWDIYDYLPFRDWRDTWPPRWKRDRDVEQECEESGGGTSCDCGVTDSFTRTVDEFNGDYNLPVWGRSDAGIDWMGEDKTPVGYYSVHDGVGEMKLAHVVGQSTELMFAWLGWDTYVEPTFQSLFKVKMSGVYHGYEMSLDVGSSGVSIVYQDANEGSQGYTGYLMRLGSNPGGSYLFAEFEDIDFATDTWYWVRFERVDGGMLSAKTWAVGGTEPAAWTGELDISGRAWSSVTPHFMLGNWGHDNTKTADFVVQFDDVWISGLDRCSGNVFDDFNRTVTGGSGANRSWGIASSGYAWNVYQPWFNNPPTTVSVDGSHGVIAFPSPGGSSNMYTDPLDFLQAGTFVITVRISGFIASATPSEAIYLRVSDVGPEGTSTVVALTNSHSDSTYIEIYDGGTQYDAIFDLPSLGASDVVLLKWERQAGVLSRMKYWVEGDAEPDWLMTIGTDYTFTSPPSLSVENQNRTKNWDYIDIDYDGKACPGCENQGDPLVSDTFTRTEPGPDWGGPTDVGGYTWLYAGDATALTVNGTQAVAHLDGLSGLTQVASWIDEIRAPSVYPFALDAYDWTVVLADFYYTNVGAPDHFDAVDFAIFDGGMFLRALLNDGAGGQSLILSSWSGPDVTVPVTFALPMKLRVRAERSTGTAYAKLWDAASPEPEAWTIQLQETNSNAPRTPDFQWGFWEIGDVTPGTGTSAGPTWVFDDFQFSSCVGAVISGGGGGGGGVDCDPTGENFGAITEGWGCETIYVRNGQFTTTGLVTTGTLRVYDADTGRYLYQNDDWFDYDGDGKDFTVAKAGVERVIACYRNYVANIGTRPSTPRQVDPSVSILGERHIPI